MKVFILARRNRFRPGRLRYRAEQRTRVFRINRLPHPASRQRVVIEGDGEEQIAAFVENLRKNHLIIRDVMNKFSSVWVFSDTFRLPELMSACVVGEKLTRSYSNEADSATACHLGADHVWLLSGKTRRPHDEDYAAAMAETIRQHSEGGARCCCRIRVGASCWRQSWAIACRLVVSTTPARRRPAGWKAAVKHMVYGGLAIGAETIASPFALITLSSGTLIAQQQPDASRSGEMHTAQCSRPGHCRDPPQPVRVRATALTLDKARLVVSVGTRHRSKENILLAEALCQTIGADACSRPVAENEMMEQMERYVGISNLMLKPEL